MNKIVCIDPGHGAGATGAIFHGNYEKHITLLVALCMQSLLKHNDYHVVMTRAVDSYVGLQERCDIANRSNADIFVSLHTNADPDGDTATDPEARGEEIWIYRAGRELAEALKGPVDAIFPDHKFRGIKQSNNFKVIRDTNMPAVLVEMGFLDNIKELEGLTHSASYYKIACLLVKGIKTFYGDY